MSQLSRVYLDIFQKAHNNAVELRNDARALQARGSCARAYALAYTALEEISKSQLAADVYTGLCDAAEFEKVYRNHAAKLSTVEWVHDDATSWPHNHRWIGPDPDDVEPMDPDKPSFSKRQAALYVDVDVLTGTVKDPNSQVTAKDADDMIHLVDVALARILEVEFSQGLIGTKGFMK